MVTIVHTSPPLRPGDWWYLDNGLPIPPPEPTPAERALAILDPALRRCPLYKAGPPTLYPNWKADR
jgi:hypothetical protein